MPTLTIEYRDEAERLALEQAIAYVAHLRQLAHDAPDGTVLAACEQLALAEVHDCFTPTEIVLMEDLGFAERGRAWRDILDGVYDRDGELPVNPDGGLKSFGHPVGASGLRMIYECWLQLRGEAGERQVATAYRGLALTQNLGGAPGDCVCFICVVGIRPGRADA